MNDFVVSSLQNLDTLPYATKEFKSYHLSAQGDSLISVTSEPYYGLAHHRVFYVAQWKNIALPRNRMSWVQFL